MLGRLYSEFFADEKYLKSCEWLPFNVCADDDGRVPPVGAESVDLAPIFFLVERKWMGRVTGVHTLVAAGLRQKSSTWARVIIFYLRESRGGMCRLIVPSLRVMLTDVA